MADVARLEIDVRARVGRAVGSLARLNAQLRAMGSNQRQLTGATRTLTATTNTLTRATNGNANATRRASVAHRGFRDDLRDGQNDIMRFVGAVGRLTGGLRGLALTFAIFSAISIAPLFLGMVGALGALLGILGPVGLALGAFFLTAFQKNTRANEALRQFTIRFQEWAISLDDVIGPPMEKFFDTLGDNLHRLTPLIKAVAPLIGKAADALREIFESKGFNDWIQDMADAASDMLPMLGSAFIGFLGGVGELIRAFIPLGKGLLSWLADSGSGFKEWAKDLPKSQGFQDFIGWLQTNGPTMINTIGQIIAALFKLAQALAPIGLVALDVFSKVADAISNTDTATLTIIISTILTLMAAAQGFTAISGIVEVVMTMSAAFGALAGPVGIIVAIIASLIAQWVILWNIFEPFKQSVLNGLVPAFQLLWNELKRLFDVITPIAPALFIVVGIMNTALILAITGVVLALAGIVRVVSIVIEGWKRLFTATKNNWDKIKNVVLLVATWLIARPWAMILTFVQLIISNWDRVKSATKTAFNAVKNAIGAAFTWIKDRAVAFKNTFLNGPWAALTQGLPMLWRQAWNKVKSIFTSAKNTLMDKIRSLKNSIVNFFDGAADWLYDAGKNIVQGLVDGIKDKVGSAIDTIKGLAGDIKDAFTNPLGIFSPSRVFKGYGNNVVEGLTIGMDQARVMAPLMNQTMNLAQTVTAPFPTMVGATTPAPMMAGGGTTTTNAASYTFDFRGAVVTGGSKQVEDMVVQALNNAKKKGRVRGIS